MAIGAELLYRLSNAQAGISSVVNWWRGEEEQTEVNMYVRLRPVVSLLPLFTLNHHLRSHPTTGPDCSDVGYGACHRGMQECDLCKELANFRWIQLDGAFLFKKKPNRVSDATMNWGRQRRITDMLTRRHIFDWFFHSVLFVNRGKKTATCAWGSTLGGFAYTFSYWLGSALFLHFKTLLLEDLNLCQISSDHRLSSFTEKKSPRPFLAFHQQHLRTGGEKDCFQWEGCRYLDTAWSGSCYILSNWRAASALLKNSFLSFQASTAIIQP